MKILMLYGPSSSGKTTTINLVYNSIAQASLPICPRRPLGGDPNDFEAVLEYPSSVAHPKKVAFFSMGDFAYEVVHAMSYYEGMGCDVLICACNDRFNVPIKRLNDRYNNVNPPIQKIAANNTDNYRVTQIILNQI